MSPTLRGDITHRDSPLLGLRGAACRLGREARFSEAWSLARERWTRLARDPHSPPHAISDGEIEVRFLETIVRLPPRARRQVGHAFRLSDRAAQCRNQGRPEAALGEAWRALEILSRWFGTAHPALAPSLLDLNDSLHAWGDRSTREMVLDNVRAIVERDFTPEHPLRAEALAARGQLLIDQGRNADAEPLLQEALDLRLRLHGRDHPDTASSMNLMGVVRSNRGDYESAERFYRDALALRRRLLAEDRYEIVASLNNLAHLLDIRARFAEAEALLRETLALRQRQAGETDQKFARYLSNLANVLNQQGDYAGAEELNRRALAIRIQLFGSEHLEVALSINNLGYSRMMRGDHGEAERLYREALDMRRRLLGEDDHETAVSYNNVAYMLQLRGEHAAAEPLYRRNLDFYRRALGETHLTVARTLFNLAEVLRKVGDLDRAEAAYRESLSVRRRTLSEWHIEQVRTYVKLGILLFERGDLAGAESTFGTAAEHFEEGRLRAGSGVKRATFQNSPYLWLAAARFARGDAFGGWEAMERALARNLAEDLTAGVEGPISLERVQATLRARSVLIGWLDVEMHPGRRLAWAYALRPSGPIALAPLAYAAPEPPRPDSRSIGSTSPLPGPRTFREHIVRAGRSALGAPLAGDWELEARRIHRERLAPLAEFLNGVDELIVIPTGAMSGVPVEALIDEQGRLLGDLMSISYAPSATVHAHLTAGKGGDGPADRDGGDPDLPRGGCLLLGDPVFGASDLDEPIGDEDPGAIASAVEPSILRHALEGDGSALALLPRLRWSREEVRSVAGLMDNPTVFVGTEATRQALDRELAAGALAWYRAIHFATHALVDEDQPDRSALVLSFVDHAGESNPGSGERRLLRAADVREQWRLAADLVTLSACETGLGREVSGEGTVGLAHTFLGAGARCVLVSLWKVDDQATCLLMYRFYATWIGREEDGSPERDSPGRPATKALALRAAKVWLREYRDAKGQQPYSHPFYWSSFILVGDAR